MAFAANTKIQDEIIMHLTDHPLTIQQLVDRVKLPYATVQQQHLLLRQANKIIKFDRKERGARWTVGLVPTGAKDIVPTVSFKGSEPKLTQFHTESGFSESAVDHANTILKSWANIAMTAQRLNNGVPDEVMTKRLNRLKVDLANARTHFEHVVFLINQILENPELWNTKFLIDFPNDKDWDEFLPHLQTMYDLFYGNESNGNL